MISIISICGFAGALSYNVYEFRKVGARLDVMTDKMMKEHDRMIQTLDRSMKEHDRMIKALDRINKSLASLSRSSIKK